MFKSRILTTSCLKIFSTREKKYAYSLKFPNTFKTKKDILSIYFLSIYVLQSFSLVPLAHGQQVALVFNYTNYYTC